MVGTVQEGREPVQLYEILMFEGLVAAGWEANLAIGGSLIFENGQVETQVTRKIVGGETIEFGGQNLGVVFV
jgi:ribosome-associated protein